MKHNCNKFSNQEGVTLIELIIVIVIIGIISTIAVMSFGSSRNQLGRQNVARELKVAFERARFDSVKRRADTSAVQAKVVVTATSFTLKTDINQNGTLETDEDRTNSSWNSNISIRNQNGSALTSAVTVTFNKRGERTATNATGATVEPVFLVCNGTCSTPTSSNSNLVLVTSTGTVNILSGGTTVPTFTAPSVSAVNSNTNIRPETKIN
jgi:prepilin-type N-terminal cleavage/methylation domain-containing protein